jgi:hypothetical protein
MEVKIPSKTRIIMNMSAIYNLLFKTVRVKVADYFRQTFSDENWLLKTLFCFEFLNIHCKKRLVGHHFQTQYGHALQAVRERRQLRLRNRRIRMTA